MNARATTTTFGRLLAASSLLAALGLAGCTSLLTPLGSEKYDCNRKENPGSPYCHSFRSVADGTNTPLPDSRYDEAVKIAEVDRLAGIAPDGAAPPAGGSALVRPPAAPAQYAGTPLGAGRGTPPDGTPVRVAPLVQRTWIKRHVEQGDRLVGSTYLYKEVTRSHWEGFAEPLAGGATSSRSAAVKPHFPAEDDRSSIRAGADAASKGATSSLTRVKGLTQPGLATPTEEVVAPPIDGASMPQ